MHPEPSLHPPPRQRGGIGFIAHVEPFVLWVIMVVYMKMVYEFMRGKIEARPRVDNHGWR